MSVSIFPSTDLPEFGVLGENGLMKKLERDGRFPPVNLLIKPLEASGGILNQLTAPGIALTRFLSYSYSSSILIPVDTFTFAFAAPDGPPVPEIIKEGDISVLTGNDVTLGTGIIDVVEVETDVSFGEKVTVTGRDLLSQLEDQDAISLDSSPIWANEFTVGNGVRRLLDNTRITQIELRDTPQSTFLLATEPGESKLAALQRFLEPMNCLAWTGADGRLIIGKPNMAQEKRGDLYLLKEKRKTNVLSMSATRASTSIPNIMVPIWAGQETTVERVSKEQPLPNNAKGPARLFKLGHRTPKSVVVSIPNATDPQGLSSINALKAGGGNLLQAYAKRELARRNTAELIVQAVVPGHFNERGEPYMTDTVYYIEYDRGNVYQNMYLFQVDYQLTEDGGQRTNLFFCNLGAIVSDVRAP